MASDILLMAGLEAVDGKAVPIHPVLRVLSPEDYAAVPVPTREQFREARERACADLRGRR